jgi:hypothetical protein
MFNYVQPCGRKTPTAYVRLTVEITHSAKVCEGNYMLQNLSREAKNRLAGQYNPVPFRNL